LPTGGHCGGDKAEALRVEGGILWNAFWLTALATAGPLAGRRPASEVKFER